MAQAGTRQPEAGILTFDISRHFFGEDTKQLVDSIGDDKSIAFMEGFGGGDPLYIPKSVPDHHQFVKVLGREAADALCGMFGGERIAVPTAAHAKARKLKVARAILRNDVSRSEMARRLGVTARYVRMVAQEMRAAGLSVPEPLKQQRPAEHDAVAGPGVERGCGR